MCGLIDGLHEQVAAQTRHCRPSDASKSPSMHAAHRWLAGEAEGVTAVDPLEILADFAADATVAQVRATAVGSSLQ